MVSKAPALRRKKLILERASPPETKLQCARKKVRKAAQALMGGGTLVQKDVVYVSNPQISEVCTADIPF